jgi:hypothetical protein
MTLLKRFLAVVTKRAYWQLYIIGLVILIASGWLWWTRVHMSTERVFWGMVSNSLSTSGVTMEIDQADGQSSIKQLIQVELGDTDQAHSLTTLKQGNTEVKTEIIGTREMDYTRYRGINTDQKNAQGKPLNVSKVLNVWSKSDEIQQSETQASGHQLLSQSLLGIGLPVGSVPVPIGKLTPAQREDMLRLIKSEKIYDISFDKVKKERKDGRLQYVYEAKIQTILYVRMMKQFAKDLGFHELDQVDPNSYQSAEELKVKLTVDALSRQLVAVDNPAAGYGQKYKGYGLPLKVTIPKNPVTATELQEKLLEL